MKALIFALLALVFLKAFLLAKATRALSVQELRRRARSGKDKRAQALYKIVAYGGSLDLFIWLVGSLSAAGLIILAAFAAWWLGIVVVLIICWLLFRGHVGYGGLGWKIAALLATPASKFLSLTQPVLGRPGSWLAKNSPDPHTKVYEKQDLLQLLEKQNRQLDNRLSKAEVNIVRGALTFGDKTVGSVMTPRKEVKLVGAGDTIGPHLMDELHASGFSRLPVVKELKRSGTPEFVGTLYLKDLVDHSDKGRVRDVMRNDAYFINEEQTLRQALAAIFSTQHHLLVVVNNFEEFVGVLAIEDIIEQILDEKIVDEFDQYDDLRVVAGRGAEHSKPEMVE